MAAAVFRDGSSGFWSHAAHEAPRAANHVEAASLGGSYPGM